MHWVPSTHLKSWHYNYWKNHLPLLFYLPTLTACRREMKDWSVCLRTSVNSRLSWMTLRQHRAWEKKRHKDKSRLCVLRLLKHSTLWLHKEAKTQNKHRPSYLETEAGFFFSLGDRRQLEEVPTNNELNASKRLRRPPQRPWLVTDIKPD